MIYDIPVGGSTKSYIAETSRMFSIRRTKHKDEAEEAVIRNYKRNTMENAPENNLNDSTIILLSQIIFPSRII